MQAMVKLRRTGLYGDYMGPESRATNICILCSGFWLLGTNPVVAADPRARAAPLLLALGPVVQGPPAVGCSAFSGIFRVRTGQRCL